MVGALKKSFASKEANWIKESVQAAANFEDGLYEQAVLEAIRKLSGTKPWQRIHMYINKHASRLQRCTPDNGRAKFVGQTDNGRAKFSSLSLELSDIFLLFFVYFDRSRDLQCLDCSFLTQNSVDQIIKYAAYKFSTFKMMSKDKNDLRYVLTALLAKGERELNS
uniref:Uncharacterized protein n=1 Tax=Glossina pallidipes TaxID=7398 RepID=A0A1A9Z0M4_GLOPL